MKKNQFLLKVSIILFYLLLFSAIWLKGVNLLFSAVISLWSILFLYSLSNIRQHIVFFSFLVTFFTFLLGRETFYIFFSERKYLIFDNQEISNHTYLLLLVSLIFVFLGYLLTKEKGRIKFTGFSFSVDSKMLLSTKMVAKYVFYISYVFLIIATLYWIRYVLRVGYVESYQAGATSGVPWIVDKLSLFAPISFYTFLATKPSKREANLPIFMYFCYALLTLLS